MNKTQKISLLLLLCLSLFGAISLGLASETQPTLAKNVATEVRFHAEGVRGYKRLHDGKISLAFVTKASENPYVDIESQDPLTALYITWQSVPEVWEVQSLQNGTWQTLKKAENHFLQSLITFEPTTHLRLVAHSIKPTPLALLELETYTQGELPQSVRQWQTNDKKADMLLLSAHPDDELIFMGGLIPTMAHEGKALQVAYLTHGADIRRFELLNALWHCGLNRYPDINNFKDLYCTTAKVAYGMWGGEDKALHHVVNLFRKYQPEVVVTHDVKGEYGHGAHKAAADLCLKAFDLAADPNYKTEFSPWQVKKLYVHLGDNPMTIDWTKPLKDGKSSLEIAKEAWRFHQSQQRGAVKYRGQSFPFNVVKGGLFDNGKFTLIKTTVGEDEFKNDFFEHIPNEKPMP